MIWLGLTGGISTGKSQVSRTLVEQGEAVIDADVVARLVVMRDSEGLAQLVQKLGSSILDSKKELDRKALGARLFVQPETKVLVESILHPLIRAEVLKQKQELLKQGFKRAFYDIPLLFETNSASQFDATIVVYCPEQIQIERLIKRDGINLQQAKLRLTNQMPIEEKRKLADYVVDNSGDLTNLFAEVDKLLKWIEGKFKT